MRAIKVDDLVQMLDNLPYDIVAVEDLELMIHDFCNNRRNVVEQ